MLLPIVALAAPVLVTPYGSITFQDPSGPSVGTDWMSEDFFPSSVELGAATDVIATARVNPWQIVDTQGAGADSWILSTELSGIPTSAASVYLPVPDITTSGGGTGVAVVSPTFTDPSLINSGSSVSILQTTAPGSPGDGTFTLTFLTPMRARVRPDSTPGTYLGIWTNTLT
jgi:hypothetical protein